MARWWRFKIALRIGIGSAFLLIMLPLTVLMVTFLYRQNAALTIALARKDMTTTTIDVVEKVHGLLAPVARTVEVAAAFGQLGRGTSEPAEVQAQLFRALYKLPGLNSLYVGFAGTGTFLQAIQLTPEVIRLGPALQPVPPGTRYVARVLDPGRGAQADTYTYLDGDRRRLREEAVTAEFDPRRRPWFIQAIKTAETVTSGLYVFAGTGRLGLTVSRRVIADDGAVVGVVGGDMTLDMLSDFLTARRTGEQGAVFILDEAGRLVAHSSRTGPKTADTERHDHLTQAEDDLDPLLQEAVRTRRALARDGFRAPLGPGRENYLVSFTALDEPFLHGWTVGVLVPEEVFVGPLRRASYQIVFAGVFVIVLATAAIAWLSRLLTRPIHRIIDETGLIRRFELDQPVAVNSRIIEVDQLAHAIDTMKTGLRSFGAYVPKELVRTIIQSGSGTTIGGSRRPLTVLFSDIQDFTRTTEGLPPEEVMARLSIYFERLSQVIARHGGTIDKFIGDAVMALWNAPTEDTDHTAQACRALLACVAANAALNQELAAAGHAPMVTRFGLHTGIAVVGNLGSHDRMQYTAIGAVVNLASRVEGLNKRYGTTCLVTGAVANAVRDQFRFRQVDMVIPSGTSQPTALFELVGTARSAAGEAALAGTDARCTRWDKAFAAYQARDWSAAATGFRTYLEQWADDPGALMLLERCQAFLAKPPAEDWNGAVRFDTK